MYLAPYALHGPATLPARYMNAFSDASYPQSPSFNELDAEEEDAISIPKYSGLRTQEYAYIEYVTGERELYDFSDDPYKLNNLVSSTNKKILGQMSDWLACMKICSEGNCNMISQQPAGMTSP
jgi:hypothetical protein